MTSVVLDIDTVKQQVAAICEREMGMPQEKVLAGVAFVELDRHFDSLSLVQMQLSLEEVYDVEFDVSAFTIPADAKLPANLDEFMLIFYPPLIQLLEEKQ